MVVVAVSLRRFRSKSGSGREAEIFFNAVAYSFFMPSPLAISLSRSATSFNTFLEECARGLPSITRCHRAEFLSQFC